MAVEFALSDWSGWTTPRLAPEHHSVALRISDTPDASAIPAMLRRRLNTLGRATAAEMLRCAGAAVDLPMVYSSRHGDMERTLAVLTELTAEDPISPINFSLAVHNAVPGILSIHNGNTANITSIAALEEYLVPVLLEAAGLLQEGNSQVLCLLADAPVPEIYQASCPLPLAPYATGFIASANGDALIRLEPSTTPLPPDPTGRFPEALRFIEFLSSATRCFETRHNGATWTITKL